VAQDLGGGYCAPVKESPTGRVDGSAKLETASAATVAGEEERPQRLAWAA
jgi:hypothetical protein